MDEPFAVRKETLYEALADELTRLMQAGTLRPGDRLPSVRRMRSCGTSSNFSASVINSSVGKPQCPSSIASVSA